MNILPVNVARSITSQTLFGQGKCFSCADLYHTNFRCTESVEFGGATLCSTSRSKATKDLVRWKVDYNREILILFTGRVVIMEEE